ncbi:MAG: BON domain-containing protein [Gemmataceae bacterium]
MRSTTKFVWVVVAAGTLQVAGLAQTTGFGGTTSSLGGTTGLTESGTGGAANGGIGSSTPEQTQLDSVRNITGSSISGGTAAGSNIIGSFYANPLFQGRAGSEIGTAPGGFGSPTLGGSTGGAGAARTTASTNRASTGTGTGLGTMGTGAGGAAGGLGGATGLNNTAFGGAGNRTTGFGNFGNNTLGGTGNRNTGFGNTANRGNFGGGQGNQNGANGDIIAAPRPISYSVVVRFPTPVMTAPAMTASLRTVIDRSTMLSNPRGIAIDMVNNTVVLRGMVKDEDEAKTAEGMIRLTPGVRDVRNELKYPTP